MSTNKKIVVDMGQLRDVGEKVRTDVRDGLEPGLARTDNLIQRGTPFTLNCKESVEDKLAASTLNEALRVHRANGAAHLKQAEQLGNVLALILQNYRDADEVSRMDNATIEWLVYNAVPKPIPRGLQ